MRSSSGIVVAALFVSLLSPRAAGETLALIEGRTVQGETYVSGGIALGERDALEQRRTDFSLWVATAAKKTGAYLAGVRVKIIDENGATVLDTALDGPWLLVNLKPGRYTADASFRQQTQRKTTTIRQGDHREMLFYFDFEVETLPPGAKG